MTESSDPRYAETFFLVEATSYETLKCWSEWHERLSWEQDGGWLTYCGELAVVDEAGLVSKHPVTCSVTWNIVGGRRVLFYQAVSQVVDHRMVEAYLKRRCPNAERTDAMNFHICGHAIERAKGRDERRG